MSGKTKIFLIGATGYIGGAVLSKLLQHPSRTTFEVTVMVRTHEKAQKFESLDVRAIVGSYKEDRALLEKCVEGAHVVFSCADADDLGSVQAVLRGLRRRHAILGDLPILIHTSGTGILTKNQETRGMRTTDVIYDDSNFEQIASIEPDAPHRNVDLAIFQADKEGYVKAYFVLPSTIYGIAQTALAEHGLQNPHSQQIPRLILASLDRGEAGMVGKGQAFWPNVHIDDVSELYIKLWDAIVRDPEGVDHGVRGYYFGENGEHLWYDVSKAIAQALLELGLTTNPEPTPFTDLELEKYFGSVAMGELNGANSRARGTHSRALGWEPRYTTQDMLASIKPEILALIEQQKQN
ncbi:NAD(P)-binding protein [Phanerochaete sordida]|uniref:NAD(P)-binding protein n=1 Tax=Phanerochaete sordida TaxID=48140 RepID=A0A9P3LDU3_9APHY|nr:NAD(P)-binding protein [Phanerochaete sordida]